MTRAIALFGKIEPPKGKPSYRSEDGTDLPARVRDMAEQFKELHGHAPVMVVLGRAERAELLQILNGEVGPNTYAGTNLSVCGLRVTFEVSAASLLVVR